MLLPKPVRMEGHALAALAEAVVRQTLLLTQGDRAAALSVVRLADNLLAQPPDVPSPPPTPPALESPSVQKSPPAEPLDEYESRGSRIGEGTEMSAFAEEEEVSREQLQMIKARTMFNMVEDLDDSGRKLLFLSSQQADLLASSQEGIQKMLDALDTGKPQLVINLLHSPIVAQHTSASAFAATQDKHTPGWVFKRPPFLTVDEFEAAEDKLDLFMADVLIPLAAQTNAIILTDAFSNYSALSASLTRMYSVQKAKWGARAPFTILSTSCLVNCLYQNIDPEAKWRGIRKQSKTWRSRDRKLMSIAQRQYGKDGELSGSYFADLDPNAMMFLLVDS
eukprot:4767427-Prymnesium_polylepis.1